MRAPLSFHDNLKRLIWDRYPSATAFASEAGIEVSLVNRYRNGQRAPNLRSLYRIRDTLGCTWEELLDEQKAQEGST